LAKLPLRQERIEMEDRILLLSLPPHVACSVPP
jgi:hypothetical protein